MGPVNFYTLILITMWGVNGVTAGGRSYKLGGSFAMMIRKGAFVKVYHRTTVRSGQRSIGLWLRVCYEVIIRSRIA
jgi:hypothetical protein